MKKLGLKKKVTATKKVWGGTFLGWDKKKKKVAVTFFFTPLLDAVRHSNIVFGR